MRFIPHRALVFPEAAFAGEEPLEGGAARRALLDVDGLVCSLCAVRVAQRLEAVEGVRRAAVDLDSGRAEVEYDPSQARPEDLASAVASAVVLRPLRLLLAAMGRWLAADRH